MNTKHSICLRVHIPLLSAREGEISRGWQGHLSHPFYHCLNSGSPPSPSPGKPKLFGDVEDIKQLENQYDFTGLCYLCWNNKCNLIS